MRLPALAIALLVTACHAANGPACAASECACTTTGCACPDGRTCGWTAVNGCPAVCHLVCTTAACNASCGGTCEATCTDGASCDVVAADHANMLCRGSSCDFSVGANGAVDCLQSAACNVVCTGSPCGVTCDDTSSCTLRCGSAAPTTVHGTGSC